MEAHERGRGGTYLELDKERKDPAAQHGRGREPLRGGQFSVSVASPAVCLTQCIASPYAVIDVSRDTRSRRARYLDRRGSIRSVVEGRGGSCSR